MDRRSTSRTYYDSDYRQGQSLIRARRPYLVKNAVTGLAILAFTASVYIYTLRAVSQDEFEDVKVPDGPRKAPAPVSGTTTSAPLSK